MIICFNINIISIIIIIIVIIIMMIIIVTTTSITIIIIIICCVYCTIILYQICRRRGWEADAPGSDVSQQSATVARRESNSCSRSMGLSGLAPAGRLGSP